MHSVDGLAHCSQRIAQAQLGHHHAFQGIGRLADHDGIQVGKVNPGVFHGSQGGFAHQPVKRNVSALLFVFGLAYANHGTWNSH